MLIRQEDHCLRRSIQTILSTILLLLTLRGSARAQGCVIEGPAITSDTLGVSINPNWGGAITNITPWSTCQNLVNNGIPDPGRSIQVAVRRQETDLGCWVCDAGCNNVWNPTQGGSPCNGHVSGYTNFDQAPGVMHTRSQIYNFDDDDGRSNIFVDQWVLFARPNVLEIHYTVTNQEGFAFFDAQEFPVAYLNPSLSTAYRYAGPNPWTYDTAEAVNVPVGEGKLPTFDTSEPWIAWIGSDGYGLALYVPTWESHSRWQLHRVQPGPPSTPTNVLQNWFDMTMAPGQQVNQLAYVIYGTLDEIRARVYEFEGH